MIKYSFIFCLFFNLISSKVFQPCQNFFDTRKNFYQNFGQAISSDQDLAGYFNSIDQCINELNYVNEKSRACLAAERLLQAFLNKYSKFTGDEARECLTLNLDQFQSSN